MDWSLLHDQVRRVGESFGPLAELEPVELTGAEFPWAKNHSFFLVMAADRRRLLVVVDELGTARLFEPLADVERVSGDAHRLALLNGLFERENVELPDGLDLPWVLRNVLVGLGGWTGSEAFLREQTSVLSQWTRLDPDTSTLFRKHCSGPRVRRVGGSWELEFSYFNLQGGVESWWARGERRVVVGVQVTRTLPNGTFLVPYG